MVEVDIFGSKMIVPVQYLKGYRQWNCYPDVIPGETAYGGLIEQRSQALLLQYFQTFHTTLKTFVDIGAGCGAYCVLLQVADFRTMDGLPTINTIAAFEPAPIIGDALRQNTNTLYGREMGVAVMPYALGDENKIGYIGAPGTFVIHMREGPGVNLTTVQVQRFEDGDFNFPLGAVKIDVEGMAGRVIKGFGKRMTEPFLYIVEMHTADEYEEVDKLLNCERRGVYRKRHVSETHVFFFRDPLPSPDEASFFYEKGRLSGSTY